MPTKQRNDVGNRKRKLAHTYKEAKNHITTHTSTHMQVHKSKKRYQNLVNFLSKLDVGKQREWSKDWLKVRLLTLKSGAE